MIRREHDAPSWPYLCVLGGLFVLVAALPRPWQRADGERLAAARTPQQGGDGDTLPASDFSGRVTAASSTPGIPPGHAASADECPRRGPQPADSPAAGDTHQTPGGSVQVAEGPRIARLPPTSQALAGGCGPQRGWRRVEPGGKFAGTGAAWRAPPSNVSASGRLARGIVPHEEVVPAPVISGEDVENLRVAARPEPPKGRPQPAQAPPAESIPATIDPSPSGPRSGAGERQGSGIPWQTPVALIELLEELSSEQATAAWAERARQLVRRLGEAVASGSGDGEAVVRELTELAEGAGPLAAALDEDSLAKKLRRAAHALRRRNEIWHEIVHVGNLEDETRQLPDVDPEQLTLCLAEIEEITRDAEAGEAWREYLMVDALRECSAGAPPPSDGRPRRLARRVLARLARTPLSVEQRRFLSKGPLARLRAELRRWAAEPQGCSGLLADLERYEQFGQPSHAARVAEDCLSLSVSPIPKLRSLAERLQIHYRNANLRVAVTEELLNRLMPERDPEYARVRDTVLGMPVRGASLSSTDVAVRLIPDPRRVRMALEITGQVAALTHSNSGPATFYNDSESIYVARKPLELDLRGIHLSPAVVRVSNRVRLRGLETDFDGLPLIGPLVKGVARSQHQQQRPAASAEIRQKVASRAKQRVDIEAEARLSKVSERLRTRVLDPMRALALEPALISAETTERRFTMRARLAGEDQLGSHTPRPRAPSDSLASFQIHQSAINNTFQRLELDGKTFTLGELSRHVAARLGRAQLVEVDPAHEDVEITFAARDPVRVECGEGRLALSLSIAKLSKGRRFWKHFQVRAFYGPQVRGRSVELARQGVIHLIGRRLGLGAQITLRGIFSKTFSEKRPWKLTPERLVNHPKLGDLAVTQFVIDDGWLGLALGPQRTARRGHLLRR